VAGPGATRTDDAAPSPAARLFFKPCEFIGSAPRAAALPKAELPEIAFVGRSNVGKSSLLNALVNRRGLARVSRTPGRTQAVNLFRLGDALMLADLPGYGFARVAKAQQDAWGRVAVDYLRNRATLRRVLVLIDARRGVGERDQVAMALCDDAAIPFQVVLTKCDQLKKTELEAVIAAVRGAASAHATGLDEIAATSVRTGAGLAALRDSLGKLAATPALR